MQRLLLTLFVALFPLFASAQGFAPPGASPWATEKELRVRLLSGVEAVGSETSLPFGLEVELSPHWKTYWRNPGVAGLPLTIDWANSTNLASAEILWPAPSRFTFAGIDSFGYTDHVIFPLTVKPTTPGEPLKLQANINLMACAELCVPFTFDLSFDLPQGKASRSFFSEDIAKAVQRVPADGSAHGLSLGDLRRNEDGYDLQVLADPPLLAPDLFIETASGSATFGKPSFTPGHPALLSVKKISGTLPAPDESLTVTLVEGERSLSKTLSPVTTPKPPVLAKKPFILSALLAAFISGLILNLMPCVLPVLSLKLITVIGHSGAPLRHIRMSFLASAFGIVTSFLALAIVAIALRSSGHAIGWGVQFQQPAFILTMVALLTLFSASLWGLIEIPLPRFMADAINDRLPQPGEHDRTMIGNFLTGAFATLLATPCSAPFVGTALGFALSGSAFDILLTALLMGLGLATPYLLVAYKPQAAHFLPRPGRWMVWLKGVMGAALMVTALWLASMMMLHWTKSNALFVTGLPLLALMILWIRAAIKQPIVILKGLVVIALIVAGLEGFGRLQAEPVMTPTSSPVVWKPFDEARITREVEAGNVVFVDVTADWCLTCLANKKLVLDVEPSVSLLTSPGVIAMKADWTKPDPVITAYLKKFGRYGIPFNVIYGPKNPQGTALPELLSAEILDKAIAEAK